MKALVQEKEQAIKLRKQGMSYRDILARLPVAKSSLSKWLVDLPLTPLEKQSLRHCRDKNISKGRIRAASALRERRLDREKIIFHQAKKEFAVFVRDPFFQVGMALYWAEGSKRTDSWTFTNSDADMVVLMMSWLKKFFSVETKEVRVRLQIHKPFAHEDQEEYWSQQLGVPLARFHRTTYKQQGLLVKKRPNYKGCMRIHLSGVAYLKKMLFWQQMLVEYYRKKR